MASKECASRGSSSTQSASVALPNMLLSTTYALNKSFSKRAAVGLEYYGGFYRPVVKVCGAGSPSKYVTFDTHSWEILMDHMDAMEAYLKNAYSFYQEFGTPTKLYLPNHDVLFTLSYGSRAISIDERPSVPTAGRLIRGDEPEAQQQQQIDEETMDAPAQPPVCKRRKHDNQPGTVMHLATFDGLKEVRECIDVRVKRLDECVGFVNRSIDCIQEFVKNELNREGTEKAKSILKDSAAFKQFFTTHKETIVNNVKTSMEYVNFKGDILDMVLIELYAFGLPMLAKDLYEFMYKN